MKISMGGACQECRQIVRVGSHPLDRFLELDCPSTKGVPPPNGTFSDGDRRDRSDATLLVLTLCSSYGVFEV